MGPKQKDAFQILKGKLTSAPVLQQSDNSKPFIIRTDASGYAIGTVLIQGEGADEHPIEYSSQLFQQAERNYSTTELEVRAVL